MEKPSASTTAVGRFSRSKAMPRKTQSGFAAKSKCPRPSTATTSPGRASGSNSTPTPMARCRRSSTSTAAASRWATTSNPSCSSTTPSPATRFLVAVKILQTVDDKRFNGVTTKIDFAENRPSPNDLREEFLSDAVLVPSLAPGSSSDIDTLAKAIAAVDLTALSNGDQSAFDASLKASQSQLEALKPLIQQGTFHLTGNSHIDAAWLWPWTETVDVVKRTFGTAAAADVRISELHLYPIRRAIQPVDGRQISSPQRPDQRAPQAGTLGNRRRHVGRARPQHARRRIARPPAPRRPDLPSRISTASTTRIGWNPDSFGYNWQLPQIYKRSGVDYFVTQKMTWNDTNQLPFKLFWWESPDGSKVLAYFPHDYANNDLNPVRLSADLATARERSPGMTEMMDLYGIGDHGGGPTRSVLDEGDHWSDPNKVVPKYQFGVAQQFFSSVEKQIDPDSPTWNYVVDGQGREQATPSACRGNVHPHLEGRALFRISPRRDDHPGRPQAQHARERRVAAQHREIFLARLAARPRLSRRRAHRRLEAGALQPVPRPRRRLGHRHHL